MNAEWGAVVHVLTGVVDRVSDGIRKVVVTSIFSHLTDVSFLLSFFLWPIASLNKNPAISTRPTTACAPHPTSRIIPNTST